MPKRLLIVDDDLALAHAVRRLVQRALPLAVLEVLHDVEIARRRATEVAFDMALLDVQIGRDSGVTLAIALRAIAPELAVAFMTGAPATEEAVRARAFVPVALLVKPFTEEALLDAVAKGLGGL